MKMLYEPETSKTREENDIGFVKAPSDKSENQNKEKANPTIRNRR
jgi:hypothetical protein